MPWDFLSLPFRLGLELQGGAQLVYQADMNGISDNDRGDALEGVRDVVERRVNAFGVSEPRVQTTKTGGDYRVIVELAGVFDIAKAIAEIGETPVLEFREQNTEPPRELTDEEQDQLEEKNKTERAEANKIMQRALDGEDFAQLAKDFSIEQTSAANGGDIGTVTEGGPFDAIIKDIKSKRIRNERVLNKLYELPSGIAIVKLVESPAQDMEMKLRHILRCFEGKTNCTNNLPALDASLTLNDIKSRATLENFADLAIENSDDPGSAADGGDLGWVRPGQTVPAFELEARQTPVGEISNVVETEFGYHIILKEDERPVTTYHLALILMPYSSETDIVPPSGQWAPTGLSGKHLTTARVEFDPQTGAPYVSLTFNSEGKDLFRDLTKEHLGEPIAIYLDGEAISIPTVQSVIAGGQAVISGSFTINEAKLLAQRLNAGALPVPVNLISQQTVGPSLGESSLSMSVNAALIGFALVALFMILYYRLPGVVAVASLFIYAAINLALYKLLGVTITLAGIAGFILSIGIAVDANVLIFERMKEELRSGREAKSAIEEGFRRAWTSIRDGNLTTLIAAILLFAFSSSFLKGFALTLSIGILVSMFSAIVVTRIFLRVAAKTGITKYKKLLGL